MSRFRGGIQGIVKSSAKLLHGIAASASILLGPAACREPSAGTSPQAITFPRQQPQSHKRM